MRNLTIIILTVAVLALSGCTGNAVYMKNTKTFPATDPATVQLYAGTQPVSNFEVIAYVSTYSTYADRNGDLLKQHLREQAAQYGANAIIAFKLNIHEEGGGGAQGVAVRYVL